MLKPRNPPGAPLVLLFMLAIWGNPSATWGAEQQPIAKRLAVQARANSEKVVDIVRRETGGRVLSVTPLEGGKYSYRIRLLLDGGRVTTVLVDSKGRIRKQR